MKFKYVIYLLLVTILLLSGCTVSPDDSNIPYNKMYDNKTITSLGCGRSNQLTYEENGKKMKMGLRQSDCLFLINHRKHLQRLEKSDEINITFISDGEFIDGIIINE